ncbi:mitochondrial cardiolipin hydrolase [Polyodon spathula]|uniref:mitochondrial cardiolipin hydrolase n=1 Tax=Polyodon spathula TaxID=7913 RepID=UPI001B7DB605|nr:mitochondrial cardiolipin hydrolase [Polyodon spathula]
MHYTCLIYKCNNTHLHLFPAAGGINENRMLPEGFSAGKVLKLLGIGVLAATLSLEGISWLLRCLRDGRVKPVKEVLFFPAAVTCINHVFQPGPCSCPLPHGDATPFTRLLGHLLSARSSLDLCIFAFSSQELCRVVLELHCQRGVSVRVVTDKDYMMISGSQIGALRKAGVSVRHELGGFHMHHKFAVVDRKLLVTGSLNWTHQAVQGNKENVLVTEDSGFVKPFLQEFEKLWEANDPARSPTEPGFVML